MNKIRVIDLINKIANGEKLPENIKFQGADFRLEKGTYYRGNTLYSLIDYIKLKMSTLNEEVEIIEEDEDINIQDIITLDYEKYGFDNKDEFGVDLVFKINELIKAIKKLDKEMKNNA